MHVSPAFEVRDRGLDAVVQAPGRVRGVLVDDGDVWQIHLVSGVETVGVVGHAVDVFVTAGDLDRGVGVKGCSRRRVNDELGVFVEQRGELVPLLC